MLSLSSPASFRPQKKPPQSLETPFRPSDAAYSNFQANFCKSNGLCESKSWDSPQDEPSDEGDSKIEVFGFENQSMTPSEESEDVNPLKSKGSFRATPTLSPTHLPYPTSLERKESLVKTIPSTNQPLPTGFRGVPHHDCKKDCVFCFSDRNFLTERPDQDYLQNSAGKKDFQTDSNSNFAGVSFSSYLCREELSSCPLGTDTVYHARICLDEEPDSEILPTACGQERNLSVKSPNLGFSQPQRNRTRRQLSISPVKIFFQPKRPDQSFENLPSKHKERLRERSSFGHLTSDFASSLSLWETKSTVPRSSRINPKIISVSSISKPLFALKVPTHPAQPAIQKSLAAPRLRNRCELLKSYLMGENVPPKNQETPPPRHQGPLKPVPGEKGGLSFSQYLALSKAREGS